MNDEIYEDLFNNRMLSDNSEIGQSFQIQFDFGMNILKKYGTDTPTSNGWVFTPF